MAKPQMYSMKWNNYQNHIGGIFVKLLEAETMVDLTLCADGEKICCHRIILSACSPYFKVGAVFKTVPLPKLGPFLISHSLPLTLHYLPS